MAIDDSTIRQWVKKDGEDLSLTLGNGEWGMGIEDGIGDLCLRGDGRRDESVTLGE